MHQLATCIPPLSITRLYYLQGGKQAKIPLKTELRLELLFGPCKTRRQDTTTLPGALLGISPASLGAGQHPPNLLGGGHCSSSALPQKGSSGQSSDSAKELAWPPATTSGGMAGATLTHDILQSCFEHSPAATTVSGTYTTNPETPSKTSAPRGEHPPGDTRRDDHHHKDISQFTKLHKEGQRGRD